MAQEPSLLLERPGFDPAQIKDSIHALEQRHLVAVILAPFDDRQGQPDSLLLAVFGGAGCGCRGGKGGGIRLHENLYEAVFASETEILSLCQNRMGEENYQAPG